MRVGLQLNVSMEVEPEALQGLIKDLEKVVSFTNRDGKVFEVTGTGVVQGLHRVADKK